MLEGTNSIFLIPIESAGMDATQQEHRVQKVLLLFFPLGFQNRTNP